MRLGALLGALLEASLDLVAVADKALSERTVIARLIGEFALILEPPRAAMLRAGLTALLTLLRRLVHHVENAKVMLGMLKIALGHHPVAAAGRVPPHLKIFFK